MDTWQERRKQLLSSGRQKDQNVKPATKPGQLFAQRDTKWRSEEWQGSTRRVRPREVPISEDVWVLKVKSRMSQGGPHSWSLYQFL